jgi:hypothetical protein
MKSGFKKFSTLVWCMILFQFVSAQTVSEGIWMVGGSAGFSSSKQEGVEKSTTSIDLTPYAGYYIIDDLGIGLSAAYSRTSFNETSLTSLSFGPFVRYYVIQNAFAQASYRIGSLKIDVSGESKTTNSDLNVGVGYSAWLSNSVALEPFAYLNFGTQKDEDSDPVNTNSFGLNIGFQVFIGRE